MKYKSTITETKDVEIEVDPVKVVRTLLEDKLKSIPLKDDYTYSYAYVDEDFTIKEVQVQEGVGYGHYEQEDKRYERDITLEIDSAELDVLIAYKRVLIDLKRK